jgi:hypothetical protein
MISVSRFFIWTPLLILVLVISSTNALQNPAAELNLSPDACIIYVNASAPAGGNGSSWGSANPNLYDAIYNAAANCEIWVAKGTYKPNGSSRLASFFLKDGVAVYGGFAGGENKRTDRNWGANITTLSGDIMQPGDSSDNSYNVVYVYFVNETAILDGFTITAGNANGSASGFVNGGGIEIIHSNATLANLTVSENSATYGGGVDLQNSSPTLTDMTINNNIATYGAGVYVYSQSNPTLTRVNFYNNVASVDGGGLYNDQTSSGLTLTDVFFDGNHAIHSGGGMYNYKTHSALTRVRFDYNHAEFGAGLIMDGDTGSTMINGEFTGNQATSKGGGLYNYESSPLLTNVYFAQNTAVYYGGGIGSYASNSILTNVTFSGNSAPSGAGIYNSQNSHPQVRNSILWNDTGGEIYHDPQFTSSTITISYSLVQGCTPGVTWNTALCGVDGGNNVPNADPRFESPNGNIYRLQISSPAINRGNNAFLNGVTTDMDGKPRIQNGTVDLGPYERLFYPEYIPFIIR